MAYSLVVQDWNWEVLRLIILLRYALSLAVVILDMDVSYQCPTLFVTHTNFGFMSSLQQRVCSFN